MRLDRYRLSFLRREVFLLLLAAGYTITAFAIAFGVSLAELKNSGDMTSHPLYIIRRFFHLDSRLGSTFLRQIIPGLTKITSEEDPDLFLETDSVDLILRLLVDIRYQSPQELLRVQIPLMSSLQTQKWYVTAASQQRSGNTGIKTADLKRISPEQPGVRPQPSPPEERVKERPRLLILHTHTSESFLPVSGEEHCFNGRGDIVKVGAHLRQVLEDKYGLPTLHCDTIHDYYPFRESYKRAEKTISEYLSRYPDIQVILDLHRDATPGIEHRVNIKGKPAAKLIMVVGTDRLGLPHPNWEKNSRFAKELAEAVDRVYPGLVHGVIEAEARYNQHLHPHAIIVEVGDHNTTLEEAYYSTELFAGVLASYLNSPSLRSFSL